MTFRDREEKTDFRGVLCNWDDLITVRKLLMDMVPIDVQQAIVSAYNEHVRGVNRRTRGLESFELPNPEDQQ